MFKTTYSHIFCLCLQHKFFSSHFFQRKFLLNQQLNRTVHNIQDILSFIRHRHILECQRFQQTVVAVAIESNYFATSSNAMSDELQAFEVRIFSLRVLALIAVMLTIQTVFVRSVLAKLQRSVRVGAVFAQAQLYRDVWRSVVPKLRIVRFPHRLSRIH